MKRGVNANKAMCIGADYYPEHWPRKRWKKDARLMRQAGFNVTRLAEFAWVRMEPDEGRFDFAWLDEAIEVLAGEGVKVILCTPTAAMPAWVKRKYPETLAMQKDGKRITWGVRKNNCYTSGAYRLLSERITRAMASHFAGNENVIGWQTDNEFGCHGNVCYCPTCRNDFQDWLRARYGTLDRLHRAWGTHFWGHEARRWDEIEIPDNFDGHNPSACLDWKRYYSHLNVRFQRDQVRILRALCPGHFITHNLMGLFKELDYYDLSEDLDFVSWDNYPVEGPPEIRYRASLGADVMRGVKGGNFWIMEQTAGPSGWTHFARNPRPGEIRSVAYQQVAHGCDGVVWFRWRTCTAGREQYWHGLLGHDGKPLRRYREAARTAKEFRSFEKELLGTTVEAGAAIVYDYENIWAIDIQPGFEGNTFQASARRYYDALMRAGVSVDIVRSDSDLSKYKLLLAPNLYILPDATAENLRAYVRRGGVLLTDLRTGVKNEHNLCHERTLPGKLAGVLGISIEEYEAVPDGLAYAALGRKDFPGAFKAVEYAAWVKAQKAERLVRYEQRHLRPFALLTRNSYGRGAGWYVGAVVKEEAFYDRVVAALLADAKIQPLVSPPLGVEVSVRAGEGRRLLFVLNHTEEDKTIEVPAGRELVAGKGTKGRLKLEPYGVAVIKL
ncbi:MAG: beta-galactosidase [Planctomycetota bacterium]|jgi:beta-galactosidase